MSVFNAKLDGLGKLIAKLGSVENVIFPAIKAELQNGAISVQRHAVISIQAHESAGRIYKSGKSKTHTASLDGYPPNSDTGTLARSIKFEVDKVNFVAVIGTNLKYGKYLEYGVKSGNRIIKPRPWLFPAFEAHKEEIKENIVETIQTKLKGLAK